MARPERCTPEAEARATLIAGTLLECVDVFDLGFGEPFHGTLHNAIRKAEAAGIVSGRIKGEVLSAGLSPETGRWYVLCKLGLRA